ncbi:MAG: permease [Flavobacteriaceae bacterium]|nr:MAG: permease [Flavobacteriaceae bacterium]
MHLLENSLQYILEFGLGYLGVLLAGISLGLTGGGGSILAMPVLVYLFGVEPFLARTYSLFMVGAGAIAGSWQYYKNKEISFPLALIYVLPGFLAIYFTSTFLMPMLPKEIFSIGSFTLTKDGLIMLCFSIVMFLSAYGMIREKKETNPNSNTHELYIDTNPKTNVPLALLMGAAVGMLTEFLGAGGGFLIVPSLVLFLKTPIKTAVGTSLFVVSLNSLSGIFFHIDTDGIDHFFLLRFVLITLTGVWIGGNLSKKIDSNKLKKGFGYFVLLMALVILSQELTK